MTLPFIIGSPGQIVQLPGADPIIIPVSEDLPLRNHRELGSGGSATVYEVTERLPHGTRTTNGNVFARKEFFTRGDKDAMYLRFLNEINTMRRLFGHPHITNYICSYIQGGKFSIVMEPAADSGSLAAYLERIYDRGNVDRAERVFLKGTFGCLAQGLAFIHEKTIRHKDLTPRNVLIHRGRILLADFGVSLDCTDLGSTTTTGIPDNFTRNYCAPEIVAASGTNFRGDSTARNRKTDVFSLGAIYADILIALYPQNVEAALRKECYAGKIERLLLALSTHPNFQDFETRLYKLMSGDKLSRLENETREALIALLEKFVKQKLLTTVPESLSVSTNEPMQFEIEELAFLACKRMLNRINHLRPKAEDVVELLWVCERLMGFRDVFCTACLFKWKVKGHLGKLTSVSLDSNFMLHVPHALHRFEDIEERSQQARSPQGSSSLPQSRPGSTPRTQSSDTIRIQQQFKRSVQELVTTTPPPKSNTSPQSRPGSTPLTQSSDTIRIQQQFKRSVQELVTATPPPKSSTSPQSGPGSSSREKSPEERKKEFREAIQERLNGSH